MRKGKKIVDYTILRSFDFLDMKSEVINYINNGWQPLGGIQVLKREVDKERYFQSMVKYN